MCPDHTGGGQVALLHGVTALRKNQLSDADMLLLALLLCYTKAMVLHVVRTHQASLKSRLLGQPQHYNTVASLCTRYADRSADKLSMFNH